MELTKIQTNAQWKVFYKTAAIMALLIVIAGLVDTITSILGGEAQENSAIGIIEWFLRFQNNLFYAFSNLGVINFITLSLGIPIYLALYQAQQQEQPAFAGLAAILFFTGSAVYFASNTVFSLFALSNQYALAVEVQKPVLEAAGRALLAQGADLTPGTFMGLILTQTAGLLITSVMLRGHVFGKWTGGIGLVGYSLTTVFFILAAFAPEHYDTAMVFAMPGGLILLSYQIMLAYKFFQLAK